MGHGDHRWHTPWHGRLHFAGTTWTAECDGRNRQREGFIFHNFQKIYIAWMCTKY
jgi:hypothetical protein